MLSGAEQECVRPGGPGVKLIEAWDGGLVVELVWELLDWEMQTEIMFT